MRLGRLHAALWVVLWAGGCRPEASKVSPGLPVQKLEIGYSALRISLPIFVAQEQGCFRRHGLDATLKRYDTAQPLVEELVDERIGVAGYAALPIIFTVAARAHAKVRLATLMQEDLDHPVSYLLGPVGAAAIRDVKDLRGKRVGILPTTAYAHWLDAVVSAAGLAVSDVTAVPVAPALQIVSLRAGGVDALFTNDPMATAALAAGVAMPIGQPAAVPRALGGPVLFGAFLLSPAFVAQHPHAALAVVAALDEAIALIEADQAAARQSMANYVRPEERAFLQRYPPARYLDSQQAVEALLVGEAAREFNAKIIDTEVDVRGWTFSGKLAVP